MEKAINKF
jgi:Ca2+-binding EF-hand superfamily protein